jgi:enoyl-CoA hydratase
MTAARNTIIVEQNGGVRRIILNRPEKLNAMNGEMTERFFAAVEDAVAHSSTHAILISGAGRAFSSGADLTSFTPAVEGELDKEVLGSAPADMITNRKRIEDWLHLWSAPKPLIAQVHGYCLGMANEVVGCCDLVVCAESVKFGMPEVREFALPPTLGFWPLRIGPARTKELLWTGRLVSGHEAVEMGLADRVVNDEALANEVALIAERIAEVPAERLAVVKQAVNSWSETFGVREAALRGAEYHSIYHQMR